MKVTQTLGNLFQILKFQSEMSRSRKDPRPKEEMSAGGGGEKNLFPIIVSVLGHLKGIGLLISNFLRGGGMDAFWNDPTRISIFGQ